MKILFIINCLLGGGRERRMIQLIKGLSEDKMYNLSLVTFDGSRVDYPEIYDYNIDLYLLTDLSRQEKQRYVYDLILRIKPDIVHIWGGDARMIFKYAKLRNKLKFKLIEGSVADSVVDKISDKRYWSSKLSFHFADLIISNSMAGLIAKGAPLNKSKVIFNGFDYNRFANVFDKSLLRKELDIPEGNLIVSMIARIEESKDWPSFISLARMFQEQKLPISFVAVGKGDLLEYYRTYIRRERLCNVKFIGFRNDVENIIRISFITVLFSNNYVHLEGISNSIMESLAAGVPVIATNGGGTNEIIRHEHNGFLVNPFDYETAFSYLKILISDKTLYQNLSKNAINDIQKRFLLSTMVDNYCKTYEKLLTY